MATVQRGHSRVHTLLSALVVLFAMHFVTACGDACTSLARKICRCERNQNDQQACISRVTSDTSVGSATEEEVAVCRRLDDTCNCQALANGDLAACGLAKETPSPN